MHMVRFMGRLLSGLVAMATFLAAAFLLWVAARYFYDAASRVPKELGAPMILVAGGVLGAVVTYFLQQQSAAAQRIRDERAQLYSDFMRFFFDEVFARVRKDEAVPPDTLITFFDNFTQRTIVLSSSRFIRDWSGFRLRFLSPGASIVPNYGDEVMFAFEKILLSIRREFGHRNWRLREGVVLGLWVNDAAAIAAKRASARRTR